MSIAHARAHAAVPPRPALSFLDAGRRLGGGHAQGAEHGAGHGRVMAHGYAHQVGAGEGPGHRASPRYVVWRGCAGGWKSHGGKKRPKAKEVPAHMPHEMRKPPIGTAFGVGLLTSVRLSASRRTLLIPHRAPRMVRILRVSRQIRGAARTSRSPRTSLRPFAARFGASCGSPRRSPPTCMP